MSDIFYDREYHGAYYPVDLTIHKSCIDKNIGIRHTFSQSVPAGLSIDTETDTGAVRALRPGTGRRLCKCNRRRRRDR